MFIITAVYDDKAESFGLPYPEKNPAIAVRNFSEACQDEKSNLKKFAEDYSLWQIGTYNEETGELKEDKKELTKAILFVDKGA